MKKLLCLLFVFCFLFSAVACGTVEDDGLATETDTVFDGTTGEEPTEETTEQEEETTGPKIPDGKKLNILFIGNSLTYYNDMPDIFASIAKSEGKEVFVSTLTKSGAPSAYFADETTALGKQTLGKVKSRKWDYVIFGPSRSVCKYENTAKEFELAAAKKLQEMADSVGAKVLLYSVFGNNTNVIKEYNVTGFSTRKEIKTHSMPRQNHTQFIHDLNLEFARELGGAEVAYAGYAFENSIVKYPEINLYHTDELHPSLEGSYLVACVFFATIYGEPVSENAYTQNIATAAKLKEIANETVLGGLVPDIK